jgi:hypothetical protein
MRGNQDILLAMFHTNHDKSEWMTRNDPLYLRVVVDWNVGFQQDEDKHKDVEIHKWERMNWEKLKPRQWDSK